MNEQEYIAIGILEAYALGELPAAERAHVEAMLAQHPALRKELEIIEATFEQLAVEHALAPSAATKAKLINSIAPAQSEITPPEARVVPIWRYSLAASVVLFVGTAIVRHCFTTGGKRPKASWPTCWCKTSALRATSTR